MSTYNKMDGLWYTFTQQNTMSNENESTTTIHNNMNFRNIMLIKRRQKQKSTFYRNLFPKHL